MVNCNLGDFEKKALFLVDEQCVFVDIWSEMSSDSK